MCSSDLCRRAIEPRHGFWTLPAGFVENGETLEQAAARETLEEACAQIGQPLELRRHAGYDHGYYFVQTFLADHLQHHALHLGRPGR